MVGRSPLHRPSQDHVWSMLDHHKLLQGTKSPGALSQEVGCALRELLPRPVPRRGSLEACGSDLWAGNFRCFYLLGQMWHLGEHTVFPWKPAGRGRWDPAPTPLISQTPQTAAPALTGLAETYTELPKRPPRLEDLGTGLPAPVEQPCPYSARAGG